MKVLVTGSAGFVGGRMMAALSREDITRIDIKTGDDARDFFRSRERGTRFDLVVHLAAVVGGRAQIEGDPLSVAVDLAIDAEMFQWSVRTGQPRVLYFSSSAAYPIRLQTHGFGPQHRLHEDDIDLTDIRMPDLSYGLSKLVGEYQAQFAREHGVKVFVARPFSGTGSSQTLDYPVPSIIDRAVRREDPLVIWSDSVRDIIHIDDVVAGALTAVNEDIAVPFNLCTGEATSFSQLARMAADAVGYHPEIQVLDDKPAGVAYRVGDPDRMLSFYEPLLGAETIVRQMVQARQAALGL